MDSTWTGSFDLEAAAACTAEERVAMIGQERGRLPWTHSAINPFRSRRIRVRSSMRASIMANLYSASSLVSLQLWPSSRSNRSFTSSSVKPSCCARLMKATRVDGVYDADPEKDSTATMFRQLSYREVRDRNLRIMDPTAIAHCMEHDLPILVFNFKREGNIERAIAGHAIGTLVGD